MTKGLTRREGLWGGLLAAGGGLGLRSLATGLPAWFLASPRTASAQDLECAITAKENAQYLIVSASSMGDPLNCNCPGTYDGTAAAVIHPTQVEMTATQLTLGGKPYTAALPWAAVESGGKLAQATLDQTAFIHHTTRTTVHGDQPKVMKLLGATNRGEMIISAFAKHLSSCLGTIQPEPIALGARGNSSELVSYTGRMLPSISPSQFKELLTGTGSRGGGGANSNPLVGLRTLRDQSLDKINMLLKQRGTPAQRDFLDRLALSQRQVDAIVTDIGTSLTMITSDNVQGQAYAAAALFQANVTPVVTVRVAFGGDNHTDQNLQGEVDQHAAINNQTGTGPAGIQMMMDAINSVPSLQGKVTFATFNVFGRNLNSIGKTESRSGRDHYGNHAVTVLIGKNVQPGVYGGIAQTGSGGATAPFVGTDIDSTTGASMTAGGDIPAAQSHAAAARTIGAALGIPDSVLAGDFVAGKGGKVIRAALKTVA